MNHEAMQIKVAVFEDDLGKDDEAFPRQMEKDPTTPIGKDMRYFFYAGQFC